MSISKLKISGIDVVIEYKNIKNLHIGVYPPNGKVRIASPLHLNDDSIRLAIISRLSWLKRQIKNFQEQKRESKREMVTGESHYFLGKRYLLDVICDAKKHFIKINHSKIELHISKNTSIENRYKLMQEWYRKELYLILNDLIAKWENTIGVKADSWQIKKMKTKWGSCNIEKRKILFNLYLARVPLECIEYIVVHELLHLRQRYHNDEFKLLLNQYLPKWQEYQSNLNNIILSYENWK